MKRFMFISAGLILCLAGLYYVVYFHGFYIDFHPHMPVTADVRTDGKNILVKNQEEGAFVPFVVKGVDLPSGIAGQNPTDYAIDEETWLTWFGLIHDMGANTVRIYTIYDDSFYNAFYRFNEQSDIPLYLLQGLQVSEYANHSGEDAYGTEFYEALLKDAIDAVDILHGNKNISLNRMKGSGIYRKDVSPWVLGYVVGNEWDAGTIAYTNHNRKKKADYQGTYIRTTDGATVFEAMLARIMDDITAYESRKYKTQKLVSFQNDPENDPFIYNEQYAKQIAKFNQMDAGHLEATSQLKSGYFASYRLYEFCPGYWKYFSREQKKALRHIVLKGLDDTLYYDGYTQLLSEYHTIPVVITGYGFSTSRGTDSKTGPMNEAQQGWRLVSVYEDIVASGCQGACIASWQDVWGRRTWNTAYSVDVWNTKNWHDLQTDGTGYGILSFDPGTDKSVCYIDGDIGEWTAENRVCADEGFVLSAKYDERCLYLMVEKHGLTEEELYIPLDVTPRSGSFTCASPELRFERAADFLLCIDGKEESRLLVQARYEALRENFLMQTAGEDPFVSYPVKDSPEFVPVRMILKKDKLVEENALEEEMDSVKLFDTFETGKLVYGDGNPSHSGYDSLADFCYGEDCVEIRIPWLLLNFSDPSQMKIHDDYYENYGVDWFSVNEIYMGIKGGKTDKIIPMEELVLHGWGRKVDYHQRLKQSYGILKESWGDADEV